MKDEEFLKTGVLVIGCGIGGASAALEAAKRGLEVTVISKSDRLQESNTYYAQGGIVSLGPDDHPELLKEDLIKTGDGINNPEAVEVLATEGKACVDEILIKELGIPFARSSPDSLDYAQEGGHSRRRILHVKDTTGRTIEEKFIEALKKYSNVTLLADHTAVDLLTMPHHSKNPIAYYKPPRCIGAYVLDNATGKVKTIFAAQTVLATGGCGAVFLYTSNPRDAIGAGYAMALRAGRQDRQHGVYPVSPHFLISSRRRQLPHLGDGARRRGAPEDQGRKDIYGEIQRGG